MVSDPSQTRSVNDKSASAKSKRRVKQVKKEEIHEINMQISGGMSAHHGYRGGGSALDNSF